MYIVVIFSVGAVDILFCWHAVGWERKPVCAGLALARSVQANRTGSLREGGGISCLGFGSLWFPSDQSDSHLDKLRSGCGSKKHVPKKACSGKWNP